MTYLDVSEEEGDVQEDDEYDGDDQHLLGPPVRDLSHTRREEIVDGLDDDEAVGDLVEYRRTCRSVEAVERRKTAFTGRGTRRRRRTRGARTECAPTATRAPARFDNVRISRDTCRNTIRGKKRLRTTVAGNEAKSVPRVVVADDAARNADDARARTPPPLVRHVPPQ